MAHASLWTHSHTRFRLLAALGVLLAAAWVWLTRTPAEELYQGRLPAPLEGFPAPEIVLPTLDGGEARLSDLRGKSVILNFWATWCPPCRLEMPALQRVYDDYQGRVVVVGVNLIMSERSPEAVRAFLEEIGVSFPIWLDVQNQASDAYRVTSLPTTFFIDPQGTICEVVIGGPMAEALLRTRVQRLEEGCSPSSP